MRVWQTETGHLACRWSEAGQHVQYNPLWMQEASDTQSGGKGRSTAKRMERKEHFGELVQLDGLRSK
jgi:hypothetical protein